MFEGVGMKFLCQVNSVLQGQLAQRLVIGLQDALVFLLLNLVDHGVILCYFLGSRPVDCMENLCDFPSHSKWIRVSQENFGGKNSEKDQVLPSHPHYQCWFLGQHFALP